MSEVHAQARTTPRTRAEIKESTATVVELAERYNISKATARKWKNRERPEDLSHRPHNLNTTLSPAQEAIVVELRCMALLPLDDLVAVVREFINPAVSRAGLDRCLRRHGVGNLRELQAKALADAGETKAPLKTFKDYEPGFLHMDIKYLPQMPDERERRYLFVAIDRATRWVFMHIYADQSEASSVDFLNRLEQTAPMKITKLLTDNGSQFTDRFTSKKRVPTGRHDFDVRCKALNIEHRLCPPRHPQTNGMVERFNGRISEVVSQTRFTSAAQLEATLLSYVKTYNQRTALCRPQLLCCTGFPASISCLVRLHRICRLPVHRAACSPPQGSTKPHATAQKYAKQHINSTAIDGHGARPVLWPQWTKRCHSQVGHAWQNPEQQ